MPVPVTVQGTICFRRATLKEWETANPVLNDGEIGYVKDDNSSKVGDGVTAWNDLKWFTRPPTEFTTIDDIYSGITDGLNAPLKTENGVELTDENGNTIDYHFKIKVA